MSVTDATAAYGIGNWHLYNVDAAAAEAVFRRIGWRAGRVWYIAAEAELAREEQTKQHWPPASGVGPHSATNFQTPPPSSTP
jgi:hypothetical protein